MVKPEKYLDFIALDEIRIKGHRIWIEHILLPHLTEGLGREELSDWFPTLSAAEIDAVLAYYRLHRPEVDTYLKSVRDQEDAAFQAAARNPSPAVRRLRELKSTLAAEGKLPSEAMRGG